MNWIDEGKTVRGYEINIIKYFYEYTEPKNLNDIIKAIVSVEKKTDGILNEILRAL